jgi:hypothetical protein
MDPAEQIRLLQEPALNRPLYNANIIRQNCPPGETFLLLRSETSALFTRRAELSTLRMLEPESPGKLITRSH